MGNDLSRTVIYHHRQAQRLSQRKMADRLGIHRVTLAEIETATRIPPAESPVWKAISEETGKPVKDLREDALKVARRRVA